MSFSGDGSPYSLDAICSDESMTCTGTASSICTCCAPCYVCCCCASLSYLRSSCSFRSCSLSSCNSFSTSSILFLSLCLHVIHLSHWCLFASIAIVACSTSGSAQNLQLFSSSMQSTNFHLHLSRLGMLASVSTTATVAAGALCDDASCFFANHSTKKPTCSLVLEKL